MDHLTIDGTDFAVRAEGAGEPVVLFHTGFVADGLAPLFGEPALTGYRLVAYHRRGYGASQRAEGEVSLVRQADDALGLMNALGIERAHLVGHSFGADIALELALRAPQAAASLTLLEPLLPFVLDPASAAVVTGAATAAGAALARGDAKTAVDIFLGAAFGAGYREPLERTLPGAFAAAVRDAATPFTVELPSLAGWARGPRDLEAVEVPALSVLGAGSAWPGFRETHEALLARLPRCESLVLPEATHLLQITHPTAVAEGVAAFLARHAVHVAAGS